VLRLPKEGGPKGKRECCPSAGFAEPGPLPGSVEQQQIPKDSADPSDAQLEDHVFADLAASFLSPEMFGDRPHDDSDAPGAPYWNPNI
jgi:hypothetical protein